MQEETQGLRVFKALYHDMRFYSHNSIILRQNTKKKTLTKRKKKLKLIKKMEIGLI